MRIKQCEITVEENPVKNWSIGKNSIATADVILSINDIHTTYTMGEVNADGIAQYYPRMIVKGQVLEQLIQRPESSHLNHHLEMKKIQMLSLILKLKKSRSVLNSHKTITNLGIKPIHLKAK